MSFVPTMRLSARARGAAAVGFLVAIPLASTAQTVPGLTESVYHGILPYTAPGVSYVPDDTSFDTEQAYVASATPDETFINSATTFQYSGDENTPTNLFLGADAAGAALTDTAAMYDTAIEAVGSIAVSTPGSYTFNLNSADDGARLYVGGSLVAEQNFDYSALNAPSSATITLNTPENFELFYYETVHGAVLDYSVSGPGVVSYSTASAAPEPQSWALMLTGFGLAGALARRRRSSPALG